MALPPYWIWFPGLILLFSLSPRWRPVVWIALFAAVIMSAIAAVQPNDGETPGIPNPLGVEALRPFMDTLGSAEMLWLGLGVASAASLMVRFRRSRGIERQQIKWVVYAVVLMVAATLVNELARSYLPPILNEFLFIIVFEGLWIALAVAVLKYRLYNIDLLINRTLVYGSLTVFLAAVYVGSVVGLQGALRALTGQESQLAVVASTLFIDRRFYRMKYDAAKTLEAFFAKLRDEIDLDALSDDLVGVNTETMQPAHVSLWLWEPNRDTRRRA